MENKELLIFESADEEVKIPVIVEMDTVWLNRKQMAELFGRDVKTIGKHIANAVGEELSGEAVVAKFATVTKHGHRIGQTQVQQIPYYNLDAVISVGFRVKSKRGIEFRKWAMNILKQYMIQGYAANLKRLEALQQTVQIQSRMIASVTHSDAEDVLRAVNAYTESLVLLDDYDHLNVSKPDGSEVVYRLDYMECRKLIDQMEYSRESDLFGIEKEPGKLEGIISAIYQNVFGQELYPSLEERQRIFSTS